MNIAIITAAGKGTRMNSFIPKQFLTINDKPIIIYTLEAFQNHPKIDKIVVSCSKEWRVIMESLCKQYNITKLLCVVEGGETNQLSIYNCLLYLKNIAHFNDVVIVHDGVRPIVLPSIISSSIETCLKHGNSVSVCPSNEAVLEKHNEIFSIKSLPRDNLKITQTPHSCYYGKLLKIHNEALARGIKTSVATCTLLIEMGEKVFFSQGSKFNVKVTTQEDYLIIKTLISYLGIK